MKKKVLGRFSVVDLSHFLDEKVPTWSGGCGFRLEVKIDYEDGLRAQTVRGHAGVGTHIDAPAHFCKGGLCIGDIPLEDLMAPLCILDLREKMKPDLLVSPKDIEAFEDRYGRIKEGSVVAAHTGWEQYWKRPETYRNPDALGKMRFPGFSAAAAKELVKRKVAGIGIDALSPDGSNEGFPVHEEILGNGKYILENLANLGLMPKVGAYVIALPPKVREGVESVARVIGLIEIETLS
ncbi:MAG: hypothetical protein A3E80_06760 [Chlamydiae bacterium RIFCSPHIGHO2_12_FULL_49_9]|nr:MAG: hypothetical protein A3E80_06760 [Chlamydiae bacterium RIFCSPHIGHO2_12_FULL_49_9]